MDNDITRRQFFPRLVSTLMVPLSITSAGNQKETASQCLDRLMVGNTFPRNNSKYLLYDLRAYNRHAGNILINPSEGFLDVNLNVQYPIIIPKKIRNGLNFDPDLLRYSYKINAMFKDIGESTHMQVEGDQEFIYKLKDGSWEFGFYKGIDINRRDLAKEKIKLSGKPITHWINDKLKGKDVSEIRTFFFGLPYYGIMPEKDLGGGLTRIDINMKNFWLYEDQKKKSLYEDEEIIIGNISAICKNNIPVCAAIEIRPNLWGKNLERTNLELKLVNS